MRGIDADQYFLDTFGLSDPALATPVIGGRMFSSLRPAPLAGRPPSPLGRIADIDRQIELWDRSGVDSTDVWWALGHRDLCWAGWAQVRRAMIAIANRGQ